MKSNKKYALCIIKNNRLLMQEQEGVENYFLPGGESRQEEGAIQTLCREAKDCLGIELEIASLIFLGVYDDIHPDKENELVSVDLYQSDFHGQLRTRSEEINIVWFAKDDNWDRLSPVTRNKIMPALIEKGILT